MKFDFKTLLGRVARQESPKDLKLAIAELLMEIARADLKVGTAELGIVHAHLRTAYGLSDEEIESLSVLAQSRVEQAVSLHDTVGQVNDALDPEQKRELLRTLWQVAYADGRLDPYEEALLRRLSELLYIPHRIFIQEKLGVAGI